MKTPKGLELPLIQIQGRDYLQVQYRLLWFHEVRPDWSIETEAVAVSDQSAYFKAIIKDDQGRVRSTAHKFESKIGFPDFIEKAETGSIGRALALIGFGTQFCTFDEGERIVDAPVTRAPAPVARPKLAPVKKGPTSITLNNNVDEDEYVFEWGKYKDVKISDIDIYDLSGYVQWLKAKHGGFENGRVKEQAPAVIKMIEEFLESRL